MRALSDDLLGLVTRRLQLLSDPVRVRILLILHEREACVQEIADELQCTPQNVSRHLGVLSRDGVLTRRKQGTLVFYSIADFTATRVLEHAVASVTAHVEELSEIVHPGP